tara:strand:+ start:61 stop:591 length:531 start_codon:yes stop_codon:yes gene_type:complete
MAALDFGMALARGLVAPQKQLQNELRTLVGKAFKTEEWWNKQLDKQIKEGVTEKKTRTETTYPQGTNRYGIPNVFYGQQNNGGDRLDASYFAPVKKTINYTEQRDLSSSELKNIQLQSEETTRKVKRAANQPKKGKRGARGSSGLMGRSTTKDVGLSSGLPSLGSIGLGYTKTKLG